MAQDRLVCDVDSKTKKFIKDICALKNKTISDAILEGLILVLELEMDSSRMKATTNDPLTDEEVLEEYNKVLRELLLNSDIEEVN